MMCVQGEIVGEIDPRGNLGGVRFCWAKKPSDGSMEGCQTKFIPLPLSLRTKRGFFGME
jgi:hypothetical protein